jgi:hypothetical protein
MVTLFWRPTQFETELILTAIREASELSQETGRDIAVLRSLSFCYLDDADEGDIVEIIRVDHGACSYAGIGYQGVH